MLNYHRQALVCIGDRCCDNNEGEELYTTLKTKLREAQLNTGIKRIKTTRATCFGTCKGGPLLCIQPDGVWYFDVTPDKLDEIIQSHLINGVPILEYTYYIHQ